MLNTPTKRQRNGRSIQARTEDSPIFDTPAVYGNFLFPIGQYADTVPAWSYYPTQRDTFLRAFYKTEPKLAGAVYSMTAFGKSLDLQIDGLPRAKKYSQTLVQDCENGQGQRALVGKSLTDFFTQDNGMFWELIGAGKADRPLRGALLPPYVMHLDSALCWRTFDEEFPVVYRNPIDGTYHKLHYTRVLYRANQEQPDELARGIGFCPVSRVLKEAQYARDILTYRHEKVSGRFTRAIGYGVGLNAKTLVDTLQAADESADAQGFAIYKGIPFVTRTQGAMELKLLDLASLPDGFNLETETSLYMSILALAFGVDAREFWPATASGATKADATIQDMKTQGKGKGDVIETLESMWRQVFPETVEAQYDYTDDEQDLQKANIWKIHAETYDAIKASGNIDAEEARAHLVKEGVLDAALLKATTPEQANAEPVDDATPIEDEATEQTSSGGAPDIAGQTDKPAVENEVEAKGLKELSATREDFFSAVSNVFAGAVNKDYNRAQFERQLYRLIRRYGERAYRDGLADGGVEMDTGDALDREDMAALNKLIGEQTGYIGNVGDVLFNEDVSDDITVNKPEMWWNKSVIPFYQAGLLSASANSMYEWVLGKAEHCGDCLTMSGQVHRMREYSERGVLPQSSSLECKGFRCACSLRKTRGRAKGRWI
jgi:hypothetical protein